MQKRGQCLEKLVPESQSLFIKGGRTSISMNIYGSTCQNATVRGQWDGVLCKSFCSAAQEEEEEDRDAFRFRSAHLCKKY